MKSARRLPSIVGAGLAAGLLLAAPAAAGTPKLDHKSYVDEQNGYSFKPPSDWDATPILPELKSVGVLHRRSESRSGRELVVFKLEPSSKGGERPDLASHLDRVLQHEDFRFDREAVVEDEEVEISHLTVRHCTWQGQDRLFDGWTFPLADYDIGIVFMVASDEKDTRRWMQLFARSARTFEPVERADRLTVSDDSSYEELLAYHAAEAAQTPGWRALPTPSKKYIVKTSSDDDDFIDQVIERLELSRGLYEKDFPPSADFHHVSVVRICKTEEEFHRYGQTGGGVAGWFNPQTTELVLYDAKDIDRNFTYSVMSHEAFHQYCHFLFEQSEAHRWFDEGHGDYYGGAEFKRGHATITPHMPGGLDRIGEIREMIREGTYAPLEKHLNFDHQHWQSQGPTNVSCYAESWSIIYMLRQGMLGRVSRKCWREEYADIIPNYLQTLLKGYHDAYEEERAKRRKEAEDKAGEGRTVALTNDRIQLSDDKRNEIWKAAMDASWGKIDMEQFEKDWTLYVVKELK
jgi:hypothetical protein